MPAGLWNDRLYLNRMPAWHERGFVSPVPHSAIEVLTLADLDYGIEKRSLYVENPDYFKATAVPGPDHEFTTLLPDWKLLVRKGYKGEPELQMGVVASDWNTFTGPRELAEAWDRIVKQPVETMGALGNGEIFFITSKLDPTNVLGDEHLTYIFLDANFSGGDSVFVREVKTRVVCVNTYTFARQSSLQEIKINHKGDIRAQLESALTTVWDQGIQKAAIQDEILRSLNMKATPEVVDETIQVAYPEPQPPEMKVKETPQDYALRRKRFEANLDKCLTRRRAARSLISGDRPRTASGAVVLPDAFTTPCKGTLYGILQGITEEVDWNSAESYGPSSRNISVVNGTKANIKARAMEKLLEFSR